MTNRIALVGIGKIARDQHVPAIAASTEFSLTATASRRGEVPGVQAFRDLPSLLDARPDANCVSFCTPPQGRYDDARLALEAGRHVMLEKPPGATVAEVEALAELAAGRGLTLFTTWHSRHAAAVTAARNWLAGQTPRRVDIVWKEDVRRWHPGQEWIWQPGGLGVFDPGINALSVLTAILPGPVHLTRASLSFPQDRATPIAAELELTGPGRTEITATFDWRQEGPQTWDIGISTDRDQAVLSDGGARLTVGGTQIAAGRDREYAALYSRFADLVRTGDSDIDLSPLRLVADAFLLGRRIEVAPFAFRGDGCSGRKALTGERDGGSIR